MPEFDEFHTVLALRETINFDDKRFLDIPPPPAQPLPAGTVVTPADPDEPAPLPLPVGIKVARIAKGTFLLHSLMEVEVPFVAEAYRSPSWGRMGRCSDSTARTT